MTRFALDTNTVSYYLRQQGRVVARLQATPPERIVLPSYVVYELNYGMRKRGARDGLASLSKFVRTVVIIDFDAEAADHAARIRVELEAAGTPISPADLAIAATARRHACTLVTHNTREFGRVSGLTLDDWY